MAKPNGISPTFNKMKNIFRFFNRIKFDPLIEGIYAHQYTNEDVRQRITQTYKERYMPIMTPLTNPELYDPLDPPLGWAYDPFYEIWLKINE